MRHGTQTIKASQCMLSRHLKHSQTTLRHIKRARIVHNVNQWWHFPTVIPKSDLPCIYAYVKCQLKFVILNQLSQNHFIFYIQKMSTVLPLAVSAMQTKLSTFAKQILMQTICKFRLDMNHFTICHSECQDQICRVLRYRSPTVIQKSYNGIIRSLPWLWTFRKPRQ